MTLWFAHFSLECVFSSGYLFVLLNNTATSVHTVRRTHTHTQKGTTDDTNKQVSWSAWNFPIKMFLPFHLIQTVASHPVFKMVVSTLLKHHQISLYDSCNHNKRKLWRKNKTNRFRFDVIKPALYPHNNSCSVYVSVFLSSLPLFQRIGSVCHINVDLVYILNKITII